MRALCLTATGGPDSLQLLDLPDPPPPGPGEVQLAVRAVALNHLDLWVADGLPGVPIPAFPFIVGTDAAGVVAAVGPGVTGIAPGDPAMVNPGWGCGRCEACAHDEEPFCREFGVMGEHRPGGAAERITIPARNVAVLRGEWSWAEAAAFPLATLTAWRMVHTRARVEPGEVVLVWGIGGGVALQALRVARELGARVAVTSGSDEKLGRAAALGAELGINHHDTADVARAVKAHFGHGADVIVDSVGSASWDRSLRALRPGGRLVTCGATTGHDVGLDLRRLFWFQWSLLGSTMGTRAEFAAVVARGEAGHLRPIIEAVRPLAEGADAYRHLAAGRHFGKIVLEVTS